MKKHLHSFIALIACAFFCWGCQLKESHFLTDETYRNQVHDQFLARKELASHRSEALFSTLEKKDLTLEQMEALEFLYAYMPISDLADYDGEFFLKQVDAAFKARDYFPWGKQVPEDVFRHFVLVYRVNNENLDTARIVFFEELKDRIKNLSMADAVLEVNHWCHEKVTYRATDGRTSAPLALAKTSWGRCGEESTFTVTALRAVGIPARQCYTPRWVHTDDNHAWVEVWVNGKWHYIGACEPEPELDAAWFTGPAKRAMMVHTNVFGLYNGPEEKNLETKLYSKINLLDNYTTTRTVKVKIVDEQNQPVEGAKVQYKVYNYAELYPIADAVSNKDGLTSIKSGMGDLMIWASKGDTYGYQKSDPETEVVTVKLEHKPGEIYEETYTLEPPIEQRIKELDPEKIAANAIRLAYEDSIRNTYMNTFAKKEDIIKKADELKLDPEKIWKYVQSAQGNWQEILSFITNFKDNRYLLPFLESLREKDLRDTPAEYLADHIQNGDKMGIKANTPDELIAPEIFSPRIALELIRPWRGFAQKQINAQDALAAQNNVALVINQIKDQIKINDDENYYNCYLSPQGAYELKVSDKKSRDVLFVAACRSLGIPARIDQVTRKPQYFENNNWLDVTFEAPEKSIKPVTGKLTLNNAKTNLIKPGYETHFTIARFQDGDFQTLDFSENKGLDLFPATVTLETGYYRLMAGSRANDGSVTVHAQYFGISENENKKLDVVLPEITGKIQVRGIIDMNTIITQTDKSKKTLKELSSGKGLVICFADPDKEPTKHILQDIPAQANDFNSWGGGFLFMVPDDKMSPGFDASVFKNLPGKTSWGIDAQRTLLNAATEALKIDFKNNFPLVIYLSSNGGILYYSEGYKIGIGENILKTIELEKKSLGK